MMGETIAVCDYCFHSTIVSNEDMQQHYWKRLPSGAESYSCEKCGRGTKKEVALLLGKLVLELGEAAINNRSRGIITTETKNQLRLVDSARMNQKRSTIYHFFISVKDKDLAYKDGYISPKVVFESGMYFLKNVLKSKTRILKKETGTNFIPSWVSAVILATYTGKSTNGLLEFGETRIDKVRAEHLNEKLFLHTFDKVHMVSDRTDIRTLGNVDIELQRKELREKSESFGLCQSVTVIVRKLPVVILFPKEQKVYILHE